MERFETVDAWTAYEHMCDLMGVEQLLDNLADALGTQELGEDLEYIARNEWGSGDEDYDRFESMGWENYDVFEEMIEKFGAENLLHSIAKALGNDMLEDNLAWIARQWGYEESDLGGVDEDEFDEDEIDDYTIVSELEDKESKLKDNMTFDDFRRMCSDYFDRYDYYLDDGSIDYEQLVYDVVDDYSEPLGDGERWDGMEFVKRLDMSKITDDLIQKKLNEWGMKLDEGQSYDTIRGLCEDVYNGKSYFLYIDDGVIDYEELVDDVVHDNCVDEEDYDDAELNDEEITNSLITNENKSFRDSESAMEYLFGQE